MREVCNMNTDMEVMQLLEDTPIDVPDICEHFEPNAYICWDQRRGELSVWPTNGGWLGVAVPDLIGDIAPWHG